jgi:RNA polymerase-binding transcription factor DksA
MALDRRHIRNNVPMEKDGQRYCDLCGQPIPKMSKLALQQDGKDVCLACQIHEAERQKGLRP